MARSFNGSENILWPTLDLSHSDKLTLSVWYYNTSGGNSFMFVHNEAGGGFSGPYVKPVNGSGSFEMGMANSNNFQIVAGTRPSDSAWHHLICTWDRSTKVMRAWIDGTELSLSVTSTTTLTGNFSSASLRVGSYSAGAGMSGRLADFTLWEGALFTGAEASELSKGRNPLTMDSARLVLFAPFIASGTTANIEPVYGKYGAPAAAPMTFSGTGAVAHPRGQRPLPKSQRKALVIS